LNALSDGAIEQDGDEDDKEVVRLDRKFKLLFGTEAIYLFIRLYTSLVSMLHDIDVHIRDNPNAPDPSAAYYDPMNSQEDEDEKKETQRFDFRSVMEKLQDLIGGKINSKEYESYCRRVAPDVVHKMASLPSLIERTADMLKHTTDEDTLLQLFDHCQFTGVVSTSGRIRNHAISDVIANVIVFYEIVLYAFRTRSSCGTSVWPCLPMQPSVFNTTLQTVASTFRTSRRAKHCRLLQVTTKMDRMMTYQTRVWKMLTLNRMTMTTMKMV
jgi:hypothetical protein